MNIEIENHWFAADYWYEGKYTDKDNVEYEFTIFNPSGGYGDGVTWIEDEPKDKEEVEKEILHKFQEI